MRIVQITGALFGPGTVGGGERYVSELVRALRMRGQVDLTTCILTKARELWIDGRPVRGPRRASALLRLARQADVLHAHQLNTLAFDTAVALTRSSHAALAATDHGAGQLTALRVVGRRRGRLVDVGLPVSEWSGADSGLGSATVCVPLFGGGDHLGEAEPGTREFSSTDFLFVGRLLPHKGIHRLISALPPGRSLRVAGTPGDPAYVDALRRLGHGKDVQFELSPPDADLRALYQSAGYTVLPSTFRAFGRSWRRPELLGLTLLESMHCGTPVIGSTAGGLPEVLVRAQMPMFADGDDEGLSQILEELPASGSPDYAVLRSKASAIAPFFTWEAAAERAESAMRDFLHASVTPPAGERETDLVRPQVPLGL